MKRKFFIIAGVAVFAVIFMAQNGYCGGTGMPWETPLETVMKSITGKTARIIGTMILCISALGLYSSEGGTGMRKLMILAFGLSLAFMAAQVVDLLWGSASGLGF